jgi:hypothetical protein
MNLPQPPDEKFRPIEILYYLLAAGAICWLVWNLIRNA